MSSQFFEDPRIRAGRTEDKLEWPLAPTIAPWKIARGTKIFAKRGPVSQYAYNTGSDTTEWRDDWQPGYVCSPESGLIVMDNDAPGFEELMERCGIPLSPLFVLTGRDGGIQYYYDGRHLSCGDWPGQRTLYAADGVTKVGDLKSNGFVPVPGSIHPNGRKYRLGPDSARGFGHALPWQPEWTERLYADQEEAGRRRPAGYRQTEGDGRNNFLYDLKKKLFYKRFLDEDDPELKRLIFAANERFDMPLEEGEVRATILKHKGLKRRYRVGTLEMSDANGVAAGQGAVGLGSHSPAAEGDARVGIVAGEQLDWTPEGEEKKEERPKDSKTTSDQQFYRPLRTEKQVLSKVKAERDPHPLSIDWELAPEDTQELYESLADRAIEELKAGAPVAQVPTKGCPAFQLSGPWREQLRWLLTGNGAALIQHRGGLITLLADPASQPQSRYPGAPSDLIKGNPGKPWPSKMLDYFILMIRGCPRGEDLTQRQVCEVLNHAWFRTINHLEDHKYVSTGTMSNHHVSLRKQHLLRIVDPAVHYREGHRWRLYSAARYRSGLRPWEGSELHELLSGLITEVRLNGRDPDELRQRAEARKHPLTRAMEAAFA